MKSIFSLPQPLPNGTVLNCLTVDLRGESPAVSIGIQVDHTRSHVLGMPSYKLDTVSRPHVTSSLMLSASQYSPPAGGSGGIFRSHDAWNTGWLELKIVENARTSINAVQILDADSVYREQGRFLQGVQIDGNLELFAARVHVGISRTTHLIVAPKSEVGEALRPNTDRIEEFQQILSGAKTPRGLSLMGYAADLIMLCGEIHGTLRAIATSAPVTPVTPVPWPIVESAKAA